jgi:hypothetical protein
LKEQNESLRSEKGASVLALETENINDNKECQNQIDTVKKDIET